MYAQIVFPAGFRNSFTYEIPPFLTDEVQTGVRVLVPFGKRYQTGFVISVSAQADMDESNIKPIKDVLDTEPIFNTKDLEFYGWVSEYYISSLGETLKNIVPYGIDVETKKKIIADTDEIKELLATESGKSIRNDILTALTEKNVISFKQLQKKLNNKNIYSAVSRLENEGIITVLNELEGAKVSIKTEKFAELALPEAEIFELIPELETKSDKQVSVLLEILGRKEKGAPLAELKKKLNISDSPVKTLEKNGIINIIDKEVIRSHNEEYTEAKKRITPTPAQQEIISTVSEDIENRKFGAFLLHGITGSGKTQVYIELARKTIESGKNVLILVPEISLTPQITTRFINSFGDKVAVMHSRLSNGERYDTWRNIIKNKFRVVIGARSALFSPLKNIGLIVVDEEHDQSYKQNDIVPKYNARDAAIMKANLESFPVLLGSATPSVESRYNAETGKYKMLRLTERIDGAKLPEIRLVDVALEQQLKKMENNFSRTLIDAINNRISRKEGVIILRNRRGFATQIYCNDCGELEMCPNCSVPLVHHLNNNTLQCHYCGVIKKVPRSCSNCGSLDLKFLGTGTQRIEDELDYYFPEAAIERVDSDTVTKKGKLGNILSKFASGETDILVGTQMVSKGLDFSNVTLVGVISAESSLWMPDFRADERTFQLLTQVAGRAGRSDKPGLVIIQTRDKGHFVLQKVLTGDYEGFYENEIDLRKGTGYPPFSRLCVIESKDMKENYASGALEDIYKSLQEFGKGLDIAPPNPAPVERIKSFYRYQIVIKSYKNIDPSGKLLREAVTESFIKFRDTSRFRDVRVSIDIDPQTIM